MNTIQQPEWNKSPTDNISRRWILWWLVATLVTGAIVAGHEKENNMKIYDLGESYSNMKMNFDQFFLSANQDRSAHWSRDNGGGKYLIVETEKDWEYYVVSLLGNQMKISLSSYNDEFLCRYTIDTSILEIKGNASLRGVMDHFEFIEKLIKKQYPNFK